MKRIVKIFSLVLALALLISSSLALADGFRTLDEIRSSGKIVIGLFSDKKPFGYVDENGEYQGYDVYFARRLAADLGVELDIVSLDAPNRIEFLQSFKVDVVLANFTYTEDRAKQVDFALPYMKVALGVVSPDSALITEPEQLNGRTLIVSKGTTAESFFEANYPEVNLLRFDSYTEAYIALLDGRGDALSTDNTEVLAWAIENPGFTVGIESLGSLDTINPAVSTGNETLLAWINEEIVALGAEGFFHADYEATLRETYGPNADADSLVVEGGVVEGSAPEGSSANVPGPEDGDKKIVIGATAVPHEEIIEGVVRARLEAAGWEVEVVPFTDYVLPNTALEDGELDANYFQTWRYLVEQNESRGLHLKEVLGIHLEPMGLYSSAYTGIDQIAEGASIAIPNDGSNESRALKLLADNGIITLSETDDLYDLTHVTGNPKNINLVELAAEQIPHNLGDVEAAVINGNYALESGLNPATDSLIIESATSDESYKYINYLVVKQGNEESPKTRALIAAFSSQDVVNFINEKYPGSVIPSGDLVK